MERYEAYKDSGIEWIGEIPDKWNCERIDKVFYEERRVNSNLKRGNPLKFSMGTIVPKNESWTEEELADTHSAYRIVDPGTIMINNLNLNYDLKSFRVGLVQEPGIITSAYLAIIPKAKIDSKYSDYMFKSWDYRKAFHGMGRGIRLTLDWSEIKTYRFPFPDKKAQQAIADYLDAKTAEIDEIVSETEQSIELLQEYRKSIISEAVTKGLDPDAPMKDSGVEWIGEIPEGWKVTKLALIVKVFSGSPIDRNSLFEEGQYFVYGGGASLGKTNDYNVEAPALLIGRVGANCGCVNFEESNVWATDNALIVDTVSNKKFLKYTLMALDLNRLNDSNAQPLITAGKIKAQTIPWPSDFSQIEICNHLDAKTAEIDELIADKQKQVVLLKEYRKSLISEAVTGKFKVPGVA